MSAAIEDRLEMETENQPIPETSQPQSSPGAEDVSPDDAIQTELGQPCWSIVTFEGVAMSNLTYEEASRWVDKLSQQNISGICIVTDEAAARMDK